MTEPKYIKGIGIYYRRELTTISKKPETPLQPIFEAFTNSLESIFIFRETNKSDDKGSISIDIHLTKNLFSGSDIIYDLQKISITDTGIGFNDAEYERFINLRDDRKNFNNKGTGRVQFLHSFDKTRIESIYVDKTSSTGYKQRKITLSKKDAFINENAIIRLDAEEEIEALRTTTSVTFETILNSKEKEYFSLLTSSEIKDELIKHYLAGFCEHRESLPKITIRRIGIDVEEPELEIVSDDIPVPNDEKSIEIHRSKVEGSGIVKTSNKESFNLKSFIIPQDELNKNSLKLVSKGEIAKDIKLDNLLPTDQINGNRYLFLLSGSYIDERDSDDRGNIRIYKKKEFKKRNTDTLLSEEEILLEDIEEKSNQTIVSIFNEIEKKSKEKEQNIEELREMFLLNPETLKALKSKINIGDTDDTILRKVYEADAKIVAEKDANIKHQVEEMKKLDSTESDYQSKLSSQVNAFVKAIPLQNRTALTQYVARRKLVLDFSQKILDKEIQKLKHGGRIDEDLMHNLIFQQTSDEPEKSDLWLINEEFIYFKGASESQLGNLKLDGEKILKENLNEEEEKYRLKQKGDAKQKRTDILLFPKEGKCIIIELKAPGINISEHLNQINRYASLINNLCKDTFHFHTFYGYLIGENIDIDDIEDNNSDFKSAHSLNFIFRPHKRIAGKFGKNDGALYTEIIKYSTLLERAKLRNRIFIDKLEGNK